MSITAAMQSDIFLTYLLIIGGLLLFAVVVIAHASLTQDDNGKTATEIQSGED